MVYIPAEESDDGIAKVVYTSKDRKSRKVFDALDWLARLVTHIPDRYEQTVRYYGHYSNESRGMRKKANTDDTIPTVIPNEMSSKEFRQNWARLIQKIYEVDPLTCPKSQRPMRIISFIEKLDIIERILRHLGLWNIRNHDPPKSIISDSIPDLVYDFSEFLPFRVFPDPCRRLAIIFTLWQISGGVCSKSAQKMAIQLFFNGSRSNFIFSLSGIVSVPNHRSGVDAPAGAIFQALDHRYLFCYTLLGKKQPLILNRFMEPFTNSVGLGVPGFGLCMIHIVDRQVELKIMGFSLATVLGSPKCNSVLNLNCLYMPGCCDR